ncbi:hypothetical protein [Actinoplanes sp. L3-i22]|uniref:hypothetical protein n=1 Tax=Actinoplanes sp. L3-i22 TaxID=2836373 RepID=UPI001C755633|nr:hypothetical protein [Actinoplanes sp. L3-i22]BCY12257.1 hypothetical protein L3i22_073450 [Actinoplanes sp. L3-i22]
MFGKNVVKYADVLVAAHAARDADRFHEALQGLAKTTPRSAPEQVGAALTRIAPVLASIPFGIGSSLAQLAGGMAGESGEIEAILPVLTTRAIEVLAAAEQFRQLVGDDDQLPDPEDEAAIGPVLASLPPEHRLAGEAWFTANDWVQPVLFLSQRHDVRAALPQRAELTAAVAAAAEYFDAAQWLHGLLQVLDDETLLVVARASGRAFRVTIAGIGDNFQLHTLLAAALPAEVLPGSAPSPAEVAAASTGGMDVPGGISGNFNLADADGAWIWNEGRPADIPHLDGVRVAVVDPAPYTRSWNVGRAYPLMIPSVQVTAELPAAEAAALLARIKPAAG